MDFNLSHWYGTDIEAKKIYLLIVLLVLLPFFIGYCATVTADDQDYYRQRFEMYRQQDQARRDMTEMQFQLRRQEIENRYLRDEQDRRDLQRQFDCAWNDKRCRP